MQTNQKPANDHAGRYCRKLEKEPAVLLPRSKARAHERIDDGLVESAAQALFEFVFSSCGRLPGFSETTGGCWNPLSDDELNDVCIRLY